MTVQQVLNQTGKFHTYKDASKIGHLIQAVAKEKNIKWGKVEQVVIVNDYPDDFSEVMASIITDYYTKKNEITKLVMSEMKAEELKSKPKPTEKIKRKRITPKNN